MSAILHREGAIVQEKACPQRVLWAAEEEVSELIDAEFVAEHCSGIRHSYA